MANEQYLTALQPFLILAKSATGRAAADLVMQATQAPNCFVFSELLCTPNIQSLASNPDGAKYFDLLKIFAYGSYTDYKENEASLPPLNEKQLQKLKQLSLITLSSKGSQQFTYASLMRTLDIPSIRALEDLIISAIYASLLSAKLDTKAARVEVSSTAGRDVAPEEIPAMVATLSNWCKQCEDVLTDIDDQVAAIQREALEQRRATDEYERLVAAKMEMYKAEDKPGIPTGLAGAGKGKRVISEGEDGMNRGGWADEDVMDLDENLFGDIGGANTSKRRTKKGVSGFLGGGAGRGRR